MFDHLGTKGRLNVKEYFALLRNYRLDFSAPATGQYGNHRSKSRGYDEDFFDRKIYSKGDNLRRVDWKLSARRQEIYLKEGLERKSTELHIFLDNSLSVTVNKKIYFQGYLAAAGIYAIALDQQDKASLYIMPLNSSGNPNDTECLQMSRMNKNKLIRFSETFDGTFPAALVHARFSLAELFQTKRSLKNTVIISDFRQSMREYAQLLKQFSGFSANCTLVFLNNIKSLNTNRGYLKDSETGESLYLDNHKNLDKLESDVLFERQKAALAYNMRIVTLTESDSVFKVFQNW